MLTFDPSKRISLSEIKAHAWYKEAVLGNEEIRKEFLNRKEKVDSYLKNQKELKKKIKLQNLGQVEMGNLAFARPYIGRSKDIIKDYAGEYKKLSQKYGLCNPRQTKQYDSNGPFQPLTEMFVILDREVLFSHLVSQANEVLKECSVSKDKYKMKGKYLGDSARFEMTIEVLIVDEETSCIQFHRTSGDTLLCYSIIDEEFKRGIDFLLKDLNLVDL